MKKMASILGIGVISMAVALAPAFAQQTQSQGTPSSTAIQPRSDVKTSASGQPANDEKNLPAKPGPEVKATAPVPSPKPTGDVKTEKSAPAKTGTDVKNAGGPDKPSTEVKAGSTSTKTDTGAKDQKGMNVKPGAKLKSDKPAMSTSAKDAPKHHVKKSSGKVASKMRAKTHASNLDPRSKAGKSASK